MFFEGQPDHIDSTLPVTRSPPLGRRVPCWATFTVATEIVHKGQPKGNTTKGLTGLRLSSHPLFPSHRITPRNRRTRSSSAFLGNAVVQILQSFESGEVKNKAALPSKHRFHQRRDYPQPHICRIKSGRLCLNHLRKTKQ